MGGEAGWSWDSDMGVSVSVSRTRWWYDWDGQYDPWSLGVCLI